MAGKTKDMSQIKQILLLKKQNVSNRKIAGIVGMNKETVNNYVNKAKSDTLSLDELLALEDPVLEHRMKRRQCSLHRLPFREVQGDAAVS